MEIRKLVLSRLENLGVILGLDEESRIDYYIEKVCNSVKNITNTNEVEEELNYVIAERVCGEYLFENEFLASNEETKSRLKTLKLGDTETVFDTENESVFERRIGEMIREMRSYGESEILCYRKMKW